MKKTNMENKNNSNGMGGGFILGLLIGILLTLLVTTKKGREILRDLMDKVINKISAIDELGDEMRYSQSLDDENDFVEKKPEDNIKTGDNTNGQKGPTPAEKEEVKNNNKPHRRLFLHRLQGKK